MNETKTVVLLVDDQQIVGEAIRRALANFPDIEFHFCSDSSLALATALRIRPAIILQDLVMPGVDGLDLVAAYRTNPATADIPIIVLSAQEDASTKSAAFGAGVNDYLVKLPDTIELIARIRHHARCYLNQIQRDAAYHALDLSQRKLQEQNLELERLTNLDGLTGLSSRRCFDEFTALHWRQAIRDGNAYSILMIDVDDFKSYNDTYGHLAGDSVLKSISAAIKKSCHRPTDIAARFGGEEFVVSIVAPLEGARVVGNRLCAAVEMLHIAHSGSSVSDGVTVSIGGASMFPQRGDPYLPLIEAADLALYDAKRAGKNTAIVRPHERPAQLAGA